MCLLPYKEVLFLINIFCLVREGQNLRPQTEVPFHSYLFPLPPEKKYGFLQIPIIRVLTSLNPPHPSIWHLIILPKYASLLEILPLQSLYLNDYLLPVLSNMTNHDINVRLTTFHTVFVLV